jgi:hypothetical protein
MIIAFKEAIRKLTQFFNLNRHNKAKMTKKSEEITRIERVKKGDQVLYTKEIIESKEPRKTKQIFGFEPKDLIDLLIKLIGLGALLFAWLNYTLQLHDQKFAELKEQRQRSIDSLASVTKNYKELQANFDDSVQQYKINKREDTLLRLKQLEFYYTQEKDRRVFEQQNQQFQQNWIDNIKAIEDQKVEERKKVFAQAQLTLFLDVTKCLSSLISDILYDRNCNTSLQDFNEITLKSKLIKNDSLCYKLDVFKSYFDTVSHFQSILNATEQLKREISVTMNRICDRYTDFSFYYTKSNILSQKDIRDTIKKIFVVEYQSLKALCEDSLIGLNDTYQPLRSIESWFHELFSREILFTEADYRCLIENINLVKHMFSKMYLDQRSKKNDLDLWQLHSMVYSNLTNPSETERKFHIKNNKLIIKDNSQVGTFTSIDVCSELSILMTLIIPVEKDALYKKKEIIHLLQSKALTIQAYMNHSNIYTNQ